MLFKKTQTASTDEDELVWVFDLGSTSAKMLLTRYFPDHLDFLDGGKVRYDFGETGDQEIDFAVLQSSLKEEMDKILQRQSFAKVPKKAVVGLGGIGVDGFTSQINYRRAHKETIVSESEFQNILKRVEDRADQIMRKMIAWETAGGAKAALVSSEVIDFNLEGYPVSSPVGSVGEKLSFTVYNSYIRESLLKQIVSMFKSLRLKMTAAVSTNYAMMRSILEQERSGASFAVIDVGGRHTEVGLVKEGRILGHLGFDVAGEAFTRSVSEDLEMPMDKAEEVKLGYSSSKLDNNQMKDIREIVEQDCKVFLSGVELVLKEFPGFGDFPSDIFMSGGGSLLPGLVSGLQSLGWEGSNSTTIGAKEFYPKDLKGYQDTTGRLTSVADVPIIAAALDARDLVLGSDKGESIWDKLRGSK